jgi:MoaA/NifB/PqqE/SkfB family radical SAM enzyme
MITKKTNLTPVEQSRREKLKQEKPYVYNKILKYEDKVKRGESIAIIQFQYDYRCNFRCQHCSVKEFMKKKGKRFFTIDDVKELSRQGDELGLANIVITGGEPLVFPDFDEIVEAIDPEKWYIVSDTNGWNLDKKMAKHLKTIGVDKIQLSLDSLNPEVHDSFRNKKGAYERAIRAIDACLEADLYIIIATVVWKQRAKSKEFLNFLKFANDKGVGVFVTFAKPVGAWEGNLDVVCGNEEWEYLSELEKEYNVFTHLTPGYGIDIGCIAVKRMISVTKYGDVMPCPYMHISLGNFFKEPLKDIIERGLSIKYFAYGKKNPCWMANKDANFIHEVLPKIYGKLVPVPYYDVFTENDFIK